MKCKYIYHGIHQIILEELDSQGRIHIESTEFKIDEIEFFMNFWNTNVLLERSEEIKIAKSLILQEFPWIWGYYSQKQITLGASILDSIPIEEPDWDDTLYAFKAQEQANGAENLPFPKLFVGQTQTELNARAAHTAELRALEAGNDPDAASIANHELTREATTICVYQLHDKSKRVLITDINKVTSMIVEQRLMNRQFKNIDELQADQALETEKYLPCKDFDNYVKVTLGNL